MIFPYFKKILSYLKFLKHNKKKFRYVKNINSKKYVMIEFFQFYPSIISFSHYIEVITKKFNVYPVLYDTSLPRSLIRHYLFHIKCYVNPFYYLYKSFGIKDFYISKSSNHLKKKSVKYYKKNLKNVSKYDLVNLKINNIYIGDLLYDEYLRSYDKSTINTEKKDLEIFLIKFLENFFYWQELIDKNKKKIHTLIISHTVYAIGIVPRIASYKNIKIYCVSNSSITRIDKKNKYKYDDAKYFKKTFKKLSKKEKKKFIKIGEITINNRISGKKDKKLLLDDPTDFDIFGNSKKKPIFNNTKKLKILVATHCFTDAIHFYGKCLFPDFFEWLKFLGELSKKYDYDWYIKFHPSEYDNNKKHFEYFEKNYKKFILLPKYTNNNDILREGVDAVLTVFGSVGHEYPLFNIPVINASNLGAHKNYNFNFYPNNIKEYEKLIKNIKKLKINKNKIKNEISEYVYMAYESNYEILPNFHDLLIRMKKDYQTSLVFDEYLKIYSEKYNYNLNKNIYNFIKSNKIKHYKFDIIGDYY